MPTEQWPSFKWVQYNTQHAGTIPIHLSLMANIIISPYLFFKYPIGNRYLLNEWFSASKELSLVNVPPK